MLHHVKIMAQLFELWKFKLQYLPTLTFAWFVATFTTSYIIAVKVGHVYPIFPMLSDTGTLPPESCFFGQMLNIGSVLMFSTMYVRHRQIDYVITNNGEEEIVKKRWNKMSFVFGTAGCFGLSIVANFQELNAMEIHLFGAGMAFGIGALYFLVQARISYLLRDCDIPFVTSSRCLVYLRVFLSVSIVPLFMFLCVCSMEVADRIKGDIKNIEWWTDKYFGYEYRLAGNFAEWIIATFMIVFILSFTQEFRSIRFDGVAFDYVTDTCNNKA